MTSLFDSIVKPTLLLNEGTARQNIRRMAEKARAAHIHFRPHFKTHQSAEIGEWFCQEGVSAITVSSVDMALYFAEHGWKDITIAFPVNPRQAHTLAELAGKVQLGLLVENIEALNRVAKEMPAAVDIWLKVDAGLHRTGLPWDQPEAAFEVAQAVQSTAGMRLKGLLTHAGFTYTAHGAEEVCQMYAESVQRMTHLQHALAAHGAGRLQISVGDTPGCSLCADLGAVDEIRPGNFVFYDAEQIDIGSCGWQDIAVALACPVVALHPERREAVIYGGAVHLSKDFWVADQHPAYGLICLPEGNGWSAPLPEAYVSSLSQEHGVLRMKADDLSHLNVGDLVCILPAHSCLTVTLMKRYLTLDGRTIDTMNL